MNNKNQQVQVEVKQKTIRMKKRELNKIKGGYGLYNMHNVYNFKAGHKIINATRSSSKHTTASR